MNLSLTFDNGPDLVATPQVLDVLDAAEVKATFFMLGRMLAKPGARTIADDVLARGHRIGNHTWSHRQLGSLPPAEAVQEIDRTQALLGDLTDADRLFRPAAGGGVIGPQMMSPAASDRLIADRYSCVLWNSVPRDWEDIEGWPKTALADTRRLAWPVVVVHDLPTGAMRRLAEFLDEAKDLGAEFTQAFPADCTPIWRGERQWPMPMVV
ncbi:MAG: polysaccharide deacetylase family protein [Caulobacterales bacterium]